MRIIGAALIGVLVGAWPKPMNLIPSEILHRKAGHRRRSAVVRLVGAGAAVIFLGIAALVTPVYQDSQYLKKIEQEASQIKTSTAKAEKKMEFLEFVKGEIENRVLMVDVIKELYRLVPDEIVLQAVNLDRTGEFMLQGLAKTGAQVNQLQSALVNSLLFSQVNLQYATQRRRFQEEYTDFRIVCRLAGRREVQP